MTNFLCIATCLLLLASCTDSTPKSADMDFYNSVYAIKFRSLVISGHEKHCKELMHENCIIYSDISLKQVRIADLKTQK